MSLLSKYEKHLSVFRGMSLVMPLKSCVLCLLSIFPFNFILGADDAWSFTVSQVYESEAIKADSRTDASALCGTEIPAYQPIVVTRGNRLELKSNSGVVFRIGGNSVMQEGEGGVLKLLQGAFFVDKPEGSASIAIRHLQCGFNIEGEGSFIIQTTSNGGAKFISLEGDLILTNEASQTLRVPAGNLQFMTAKDGFGPNVYLNLALLLESSALIQSFTVPPPSIDEIQHAAFLQSHKLKGHSNALIGDAPDDENFNLILLK